MGPMEQGGTTRPVDTVSAAYSDITALLKGDVRAAETAAMGIVERDPGDTNALMLLVSARRLAGDLPGARDLLQNLARAQPQLAAVQFELGMLLSKTGDDEAAIAAFSRAVELEPAHAKAWRALGDALSRNGKATAAARAYEKHLAVAAAGLQRLERAAGCSDEELAASATQLGAWLGVHATDVAALRMLAGVCIRQGRYRDAEKHLREVMRLAPHLAQARYTLAMTLYHQTKIEETIGQLDLILKDNPGNVASLNLKARSLLHLGDYAQAIASYEALLKEDSTVAACFVGYGHALKTVGRVEDAVAALKQALALEPGLGEAYWQLADLKTFRFTPAEVRAMRSALAQPALTNENGALLHFALGKALEDIKAFEQSFEEYAEGNAMRRRDVEYSADDMSAMVRRSKALFTADFFRERQGFGCDSPDPILIVGLTRSGSTLIEQILASHPLVEGTKELPTLNFLAAQLRERSAGLSDPEIAATLGAAECRRLGEEYLALTRTHRKQGRPYFVDKMPSNFHHLGLLHLILPNARIVDARRHPLGCGFANFKQHFTHGQSWSYDLVEIGRYYRDYVELLAHFDAVLPGRVHRVFYEDVIADPERESRRLLDYCGIPFDAACLRFYENKRAVLTASAEQVRKPIFSDALEQWRHFEPWLEPLKAALGQVLDAYPAAPRFDSER